MDNAGHPFLLLERERLRRIVAILGRGDPRAQSWTRRFLPAKHGRQTIGFIHKAVAASHAAGTRLLAIPVVAYSLKRFF
jgi:hypothetical protein